MKNAPRRTNAWNRIGIPVILLGYSFAMLGLEMLLAVAAWPGNRAAVARTLRQAEPGLIVEITGESLITLRRAKQALTRFDREGAPAVTAADRDAIKNGLELASTAVTNSADVTVFGGDLQKVTARDRSNAFDLVRSAILLLEARTRSDGRRELDAKAVSPPLTSGEQAELRKRGETRLRLEGAYFLGSPDLEILSVLIAFGAIGATIQVLGSIAIYLGNGRFVSRWAAYYVVRPFIGAILAATFHFVMRAGIFTPQSAQDVASVNVGCAIALLVGLFSGEAMERLKEVAAAVFTGKSYANSAAAKLPHIRKSDVNYTDSPAFKGWAVILHGSAFRPDSVVLINGQRPPALMQAYVDTETLSFKLKLDDYPPASRTLSVAIHNPEPNPGDSDAVEVGLTQPNHS